MELGRPATAALRLVESTKTGARGVTAMSETKRMTSEQVVGYLFEGVDAAGCGGSSSGRSARTRPCPRRLVAGQVWATRTAGLKCGHRRLTHECSES